MRYFLILLALSLFSPVLAFAQGSDLAGPQYSFMARQALESRPADFNFMSFRSNYAGTKQYDPLGAQAKEWLLKYAYTAQNDSDPAKRRKAFDEYGTLLADHLANIDVVTLALSLSLQDKRFGDPAFFTWLRRGLTQSVLDSGNGETLAGAYDVITLGEEPALLQALNVQVLKTDARHSDELYYNMHEVRDNLHTGPYTIFVNVSEPLSWLERQKRERTVNFSIPRQ